MSPASGKVLSECLGKDKDNLYYSKALSNGLPKCTMPVFFKFDLKEVIMTMSEKCYYSNGNMQTNWARVTKVSDDPTELNKTLLYSKIKNGFQTYLQYSQQ